MAFTSTSVSKLLILLLLVILLLIHETQSRCPDSFHFYCPDNVYNGQFKLRNSVFTNRSLHDQHCGGPCELTCDDSNRTMVQCTQNAQPPIQLLYINPSNSTIAVQYPDWLLLHSRDMHFVHPCKVYSVLNGSFPSFRLVSMATSWGKRQTYLGCPYPEGDDYWDSDDSRYEACWDNYAIVYGPYLYGQLPRGKPLPAGCKQFSYLPSNANGNKGKVRLKIIVCSVISVIAIVISIAFLVYWRRRKNNPGSATSPSRIISLNHTRLDLEEGSMINGMKVFSYAELEQVTNSFDPTKQLGEGGFGIVYHGKLKDGREVAVKRMYEKNYKQVEQFKNEIQILTNMRHQNLVTLYGSTSRHSHELLLVYEYIPNGTLADHLHGKQSKSVLLLWPTRMKIAIETATALSYLHYNEIIHRDIKTNNILLDRNFCAKVADFGLSRLFPADVTHLSTAPQGTPGYVDPEYHHCYHLTDKSDVYSFGVVLIELISSLPAIDMGRRRHEINLSSYAMNRIQYSAFHELVDPSLGYEKSFKVRRMTSLVAELAFQCLQHEREIRPSMLEVLEALKRIESGDYDELEEEEMWKSNAELLSKQISSPTITDSDDAEL